jgi:molybdate transport system substrate-binding protein
MSRQTLWYALAILAGVTAFASARETVSLAAASNLVYVLDSLDAAFKRSSPAVDVTVTTGASGSLFAQIRNGAPFDVFLSADREYPEQIVAARLGDAASLRTFATGRLAVWTTRADLDVGDLRELLLSPEVKKIALAQPRTAPYGRAGQAALQKLGVWRDVERKLIFGENITQTAQFVETGNADAGLVALSLLLSPNFTRKGRWKEIPAEWHESVSLDHAAVLTLRGAANPAARRFLAFLETDAAKKILREHGYAVK